jgi:LacI family sucrose operon transcriptional repressor
MTTIKDVARLSGVTVTTVSRVLNNRGYIGEQTRAKVMAAIATLNYHPNELARSLTRRRSMMIGLIIPTVAHPFFGELAAVVERVAYDRGYKVLLCNSRLDREKESDYLAMLSRNKVDGIIMGSQTLDVDAYSRKSQPVVSIDRCISPAIPYVSSDNYHGGKLATEHLISCGCRKLAHISGNLNLNMLANRRYDAFIAAAGNRAMDTVTVQTNINGLDIEGYDAILHQLFTDHPDIDGLFCSSDVLAASAMRLCRARGKRVPEEIKIVGYDDVPLAAWLQPALTTIRQPIGAMAELAVDLLLGEIDGQTVAPANILPVSLIVRGSTAG